MTTFLWKLFRYILVIVLTPISLLALVVALAMCMLVNDRVTFDENIRSFINSYKW